MGIESDGQRTLKAKYVVFCWESGPGIWRELCFARDLQELRENVSHCVLSKGYEIEDLQCFEMDSVPQNTIRGWIAK